METFRDNLTNFGTDDHLEDLLESLASKNSYWEACKKFYDQRRDDRIEYFTSKQKSWAMKICLDLYQHYEDSITAEFVKNA